MVNQRGGPARLQEHLSGLRSCARTVTRAEIRFNDHPATRPKDTLALSVDQLALSHPDVGWHTAVLNAALLSPTEYYWISEAWCHMSPDASWGGPCRPAASVSLAADLTRTWA